MRMPHAAVIEEARCCATNSRTKLHQAWRWAEIAWTVPRPGQESCRRRGCGLPGLRACAGSQFACDDHLVARSEACAVHVSVAVPGQSMWLNATVANLMGARFGRTVSCTACSNRSHHRTGESRMSDFTVHSSTENASVGSQLCFEFRQFAAHNQCNGSIECRGILRRLPPSRLIF